MIQLRVRWLILLLLIITLTSCTFARGDQSVITLTLSGWQSNPNEAQLLRRVLQDFAGLYPDIRVKYEVINEQYMDAIKTRLISDTAPDVFYLDAFEAPLFMKNDVWEPLDPYITPEFNLSDFLPTLVNAFKYHHQIYGLPKDFSTLALFYNKQDPVMNRSYGNYIMAASMILTLPALLIYAFFNRYFIQGVTFIGGK